MSLHLSRVRLRRDASVGALAPLLLPNEPNTDPAAGHHLLWSLFADGEARTRDFLWREEGSEGGRLRRRFLVLSQRPPEDRHGLFEVESQSFEPSLAAGDRLRFVLRANPAKSRATPGARGRRYDPVAAALSELPPEKRAVHRYQTLQDVGTQWLAAQGERNGFDLARDPDSEEPRVQVEADDWRVLPRGAARPISFSVLDFEGELVVNEPALFLQRLEQGFGRAKAFGCGLMLIRRA